MDCLDDTFTEMDLDLMDEVEPAAVRPKLLMEEAKKRRRSKSAKKAASPPDNEENLTVKRNVANSQVSNSFFFVSLSFIRLDLWVMELDYNNYCSIDQRQM